MQHNATAKVLFPTLPVAVIICILGLLDEIVVESEIYQVH